MFTPEQCAELVAWFEPGLELKESARCGPTLCEAVSLDDGEMRRTRRPELYAVQDWLLNLSARRHTRPHLISFIGVRYRGPGGFLGEHTDNLGKRIPGVSATIQLSPSTAYEGGDLWFPEWGFTASREQGVATGFGFHDRHEVTPLTSGVRDALVVFLGEDSERP